MIPFTNCEQCFASLLYNTPNKIQTGKKGEIKKKTRKQTVLCKQTKNT